jgi:hypothetical protein
MTINLREEIFSASGYSQLVPGHLKRRLEKE